MRFGSVCSGIEAASVAWEPLGWEADWFSEIEPFPCAVLSHHYPNVPNYGDMTLLPDRILSGEISAPDLFCGGTPCQAFSVAGLRRSLEDSRGNLSLTFCEIANAIDHIRVARGESPCIVFWENVPGVLNTPDNAFGCFLAGLAGEDDPLIPAGKKWTNAGCVFGPKRAVAWRVTDAQYFGVAQRRRRVFVVASAREGFNPTQVLFEFDGVRSDTAPSREAGKETSRCLTTGTSQRYDAESETMIPVGVPDVMVTLLSSTAGISRPGNEATEHETYIPMAQAISIHPHCVGRSPTAGPQGKEYLTDGSAYCMDSRGQTQAVAHSVHAFDARQSEVIQYGDMSGPLDTDGHSIGVIQPIPFDTTQLTSPSNYSNPKAGDPCHPLASGAHAPAVVQPIGLDEEQNAMIDAFGTLKARAAGGGFEGSVMQTNMAVRRLTPVECERLQGFPDGYTNIPWRNKSESPDGPRYKALGNSWAVPNVRWIGQRIKQHLENMYEI